MPEVLLPFNGGLSRHRIDRACSYRPPLAPLVSRTIYSAAHVAAQPDSQTGVEIDWDATLAFRRYLWSYGLGVAEAMDTAQRGMGLSWEGARELIRRSLKEAQACDGLIACGAGTDQLADHQTVQLEDVIEAYLEQCDWVERHGGRVVLMASRALARTAASADDYYAVYARILSQLRQPAILHWLGDMFDPQLAGYWGTHDLDRAMETFVCLVRDHAARLDGVKISLLDDQREIEMRRRLPAGQRVYTGDDFHYDGLIRGDGTYYGHARCWAFSTRLLRPHRLQFRLWTAMISMNTIAFSAPRCRLGGISSSIQPIFIKRASRSWPI